MYYGLSFTSENPKELPIYKLIAKESNKRIDKPRPSNSWWLCHTFWKEYKNWGEIETLYNLAYGNFQSEFSEKLNDILKITYSVIANYEENDIS